MIRQSKSTKAKFGGACNKIIQSKIVDKVVFPHLTFALHIVVD